jgi:hypothetical protein
MQYTGHQGLYRLGVKRQEFEADHSSPSSTEVKNGEAMPPFPHVPSFDSAELYNLGQGIILPFTVPNIPFILYFEV